MKKSFYFFSTVTLLALSAALLGAQAEPAKTAPASTNAIPQSVFTMPTNRTEGIDPFFPKSDRLWARAEAAPVVVKPKATGMDCLTLKGLSGTPSSPLAMVNGRTMAPGEDAEIVTDCGRLLVHCVDITTNSAIIEVSGERRELRLRSDF
jgi:hypothetical protein